MKRVIQLAGFLTAIFAIAMYSCKDGTDDPNPLQDIYGGTVDKTNMFGFDEPIWLLETGFNNMNYIKVLGYDLDVTIELMGSMGCTSNRFRLANIWSKFSVNYETGEFEMVLNAPRVQFYHNVMDKFKAAGMKLFIGSTGIFPPFVNVNGNNVAADLGAPYGHDACYKTWLKAVTVSWEIIAEAFPEIKYWETGNELNKAELTGFYRLPRIRESL